MRSKFIVSSKREGRTREKRGKEETEKLNQSKACTAS